ncbi:M23 family metallopeptidase, partial [Candidatus Aerophobetes bacterium]|nr:M23 family metallopeptidase [Candidatus Aerophobetes bacterium]
GWLRNYGRTIIIEHKELGLYTCYMHNLINLVEKDQVVKKGEPIARVGNTGTVEEPLLHFEVRRAKDGKPLDPFEYLSSDFSASTD